MQTLLANFAIKPFLYPAKTCGELRGDITVCIHTYPILLAARHTPALGQALIATMKSRMI